MFESLKKNIKRRKLSKMEVSIDRKISFHNFRTARSCLFFGIEGEFPEKLIEQLKKELSEHMEVHMLFLNDWDRPVSDRIKSAVYVTEEDVSRSGSFLNEELEKAVNFSYDLLIDFSVSANAVGDFILRNSRAKCKLGMERSGFQNDIIFEGMEDKTLFIRRLTELLNTTNS